MEGIGNYELLRLRTAKTFFTPAIVNSDVIQNGAVALEIGCGRGFKAAIFGDLFHRYVGVDLNAEHVNLGNDYLRRVGGKAQLHVANGLEVLASPRRFGLEKQPDFLILFAVLEHLLPDERQQMLGLARQIVDDGGSVLIAETPNRLIPLDAHSSNLQFAQMLPPDLMLRYMQKLENQGWRHSLMTMGNDVTALYRAGVSLSYHDFELDFGENLPFVISGWSGDLIAQQPLRNDEEALYRYFIENDLPVHPAFSRYWIEGLISHAASRHHVSTTVARLLKSDGHVHPGLEAWNRPAATVYQNRAATYACENIAGDQFEVIVQIDLTSSEGPLAIEIDGISHEFEPKAQDDLLKGHWHKIATFRATVDECPRQIVVTASGHGLVRSIASNGYDKAPTANSHLPPTLLQPT